MLAFFALAFQLKLKVNRIFHSNALKKRVFYLSSPFSLLLDFVVSILLFTMTQKYRLAKVIVTRSALHRRISREKNVIERIQCNGNLDKYSHVLII